MLVGMRDYQDEKADVIHKYSGDEARSLKACGELPESGKSWHGPTQPVSLPAFPLLALLGRNQSPFLLVVLLLLANRV